MLGTLRKFPATFHVVNVMEIFERMAWYGFYAVAGLYITGSPETGGLGLSDEDRGVITGVVPFILYLLPVVTGALADNFGYKRTFLLAYMILAPGYFLLGQAGGFLDFFLLFLVVAVGAALFKPVVTGTVARVTTDETKALGFGIFYMVVNIGGFLGPLVATVVRGWGWSWVFLMSSVWISLNFIPLLALYEEPRVAGGASAAAKEPFSERMRRVWTDMTQVLGNARFFLFVAILLVLLMLAGGGRLSWTGFFVAGGAWVALNAVVDLALARGLAAPRGARAGVDAAERPEEWPAERPPLPRMRLGDWRFGLYLLLLGGFWTIFNQIFLTMPLYIRDYTDTTAIQDGVRSALAALPLVGGSLVAAWDGLLGRITEDGQIKPENLINLDALAIVFGQVAISAIFARRKPLATMILGTLVTAVSMLLGVWSAYGWICVASIVVFAVGEMMASPKSQEYVARIAPPGKEAMYMGYYFVAIALGNLFGGLLSGKAYGFFANPKTGIGRPDLMWLIFTGIALATALALYVFDRRCVRGAPRKATSDPR